MNRYIDMHSLANSKTFSDSDESNLNFTGNVVVIKKKKKKIVKKRSKNSSKKNVNSCKKKISNNNIMDKPEIIKICNRLNVKWFPLNVYRTKDGGKGVGEMYELTRGGKYDKGLMDLKNSENPIDNLDMLAEKGYKVRKYKSGKYGNTPSQNDFDNLTDKELADRQLCWMHYDYIAIDTRKIKQIDIDSPDYDDWLVKELETSVAYKSITKEFGRHIFVKDEEDYANTEGHIHDEKSMKCPDEEYCKKHNWCKDSNMCKYHGLKKIEYLCGKWAWAKLDCECINSHNCVMEKPTDKVKVSSKEKKQIKNKVVQNTLVGEVKKIVEENCSQLDIQKWFAYADIVDNAVWATQNDWFKLLCSAKNCGIPYDKLDTFLSKKPGYDANDNYGRWLAIDKENGNKEGHRCGWTTLYQIAQECNQEKKAFLDEEYLIYEKFNIFKFYKIKGDKMNEINEAKQELEELEKSIEELEDKIDEDDYAKKSEKKKDKSDLAKKKKQVKKSKRLIKEMHDLDFESEYKKRKAYFEKFHRKILSPYNLLRTKETKVEVLNKSDFLNVYENLQYGDEEDFIKKWLKDKDIKTNENIDFLPYPLECPNDCYNTFKGLAGKHLKEHDMNPENDKELTLKIIQPKFIC